MSAFIVNKQTIDVIVKGIEIYNVNYDAENYKALAGFIIDAQEMRNGKLFHLANALFATGS